MYRFGILTASDKGACGQREDVSGQLIAELLAPLGQVRQQLIVADEQDQLIEALLDMTDRQKLDLVLTTGGTGLSPRDVTPEATLAVIERQVPGLAEAMRARSLAKTDRAMLSRGVAGIRGKTLIVNLPGSPKAVQECLGVILPVLPHGLEILTGQAGECAR